MKRALAIASALLMTAGVSGQAMADAAPKKGPQVGIQRAVATPGRKSNLTETQWGFLIVGGVIGGGVIAYEVVTDDEDSP